MLVPSSNLLNIALTVINPMPVTYFKFKDRTNNDIGLLVTSYEEGVVVYGSVQAVPRSVYEQFGLDFQKNYVSLWVRQSVIDINRNQSGDQIEWAGRRFECKSETNWYNMDGWTEVLCVDVGKALPKKVAFVDPLSLFGFGVAFGRAFGNS